MGIVPRSNSSGAKADVALELLLALTKEAGLLWEVIPVSFRGENVIGFCLASTDPDDGLPLEMTDLEKIEKLRKMFDQSLRVMPAATKAEAHQDIAEIIIESLYADKETLKQCSLICRDWLPSSSHYLLRRVQRPRPVHLNMTCDYFTVLGRTQQHSCSCPHPSETSFTTCIALISSSSRLRHYIRELKLTSCRPPCFRIPVHHYDFNSEPLDLSVLISIINLLPTLEGLHLLSCALRSEYPPPGALLLNSLPVIQDKLYSLRSLLIEEFSLPSAVQAVPDFLSLFRRIEKLSIGQIFN